MKYLFLSLALFFSGFLAGCSGTLHTPDQLIYISTAPVTGASCHLHNDLGAWDVPCTPAMVRVCRSDQPLFIQIHKEGYRDEFICVQPRPLFARMVWGRLVNHCSTVNEYPDGVRIPLTANCGY